MPLVSVCIPAYNSEATLGETLETVLAQDYPKLDIIVSDNHSTDYTKTIVQQYAKHGVRYCTPGKRPDWAADLPGYIGAYINANFVLSQGNGEYLCLFHSDDLYESSIVRRQVEMMQTYPKVGAVFTGMRMIGEDSRPIRMDKSRLPNELCEHPTFDFATLLNAVLTQSNFLPTPSVMLRRSVVEQVGGFNERQFLTSADLEMWLRIASQGYEIGFIDQPLLNYRISQRQFGGQYNKLRTTLADFFGVLDHYLNQPGMRAVAQPHSLALYELQRAADQVLCAMNLMAQGKISEAQKFMKEALQIKHFVTAFQRPRWLARLFVGLGLVASTWFGLGSFAGRSLYQAYQRDLRRRQQPLTKD